MGTRKENLTKLVSDEFLRKALKEDIGSGDITTDSLISKKQMGAGVFLAKQDLVLCGTDLAERIFHLLNPKIKVKFSHKDGDVVSKNTHFGEVKGPFHELLKGERTALNLLQRLSGISTITHQYQSKIINNITKILDTRKTLPHYRMLEKFAVKMGGGTNHRLGLYDQVLIKDNHIAACGGNIFETTKKARVLNPKKKLVVEIQHFTQIEDAISGGADRLLLDNMTNSQIRHCLTLIKKRVPVEISGQVTLSRIASLSKLGVDFISVGAITHSAPSADISLKIKPV